MVLGGFERYDSLREGLLVILVWTIFCGFLFFFGIDKNALILYKAYVLRTNYVEKCRSDKKLLICDLG